jgi:hypothetical protein
MPHQGNQTIYTLLLTAADTDDQFEDCMLRPLSARGERESLTGDSRVMGGKELTVSSSVSGAAVPYALVAVPVYFTNMYGSMAYMPQISTHPTISASVPTAASPYSVFPDSSGGRPGALGGAQSYYGGSHSGDEHSGTDSLQSDTPYSSRSSGSDGSSTGSTRTSSSTAGSRSGNTVGQKRKLQSKPSKAAKSKQESDIAQSHATVQLKRDLLDKQLRVMLDKLEVDKRQELAKSNPPASGDTAGRSDQELAPDTQVAACFTNLTLAYNRGSMAELRGILDRSCADNCSLRACIVKFDDTEQPFVDREVPRKDIAAFFKALADVFPDSVWQCEPAEIRKHGLLNVVVGHTKFRCE